MPSRHRVGPLRTARANRDQNTLDAGRLKPVIAHELEHLGAATSGQFWSRAWLRCCCSSLPPFDGWVGKSERRGNSTATTRRCGCAGTEAAYATALGVLAERVSGSWATAVMGDKSPSLARRIKRIVKGDTMKPLNGREWAGVLTALIVTVVTGTVVLGAALDTVRAARRASERQAAQGTVSAAVRTAFRQQQPGSPIRLTGATGNDEYCFAQVGVRNSSERPITSVTFIGVIEHAGDAEPAIVVRSKPVAVAVAPGATADLSVALLPVTDVLQWKFSKGYRAQAMLGVVEVEFADGDKWIMRPPAGAMTENDVFQTPRPEVSRARITGPQYVGPAGAPCRDDRGLAYSEGAMVRIKGEANAVAVCTKSGWVEQQSSGSTELWVQSHKQQIPRSEPANSPCSLLIREVRMRRSGRLQDKMEATTLGRTVSASGRGWRTDGRGSWSSRSTATSAPSTHSGKNNWIRFSFRLASHAQLLGRIGLGP